MGKLWEKDYQVNSLLEDFTVGDDYILDKSLVGADCLASIAHAKMLEKIGILGLDEGEKLTGALRIIITAWLKNDFVIDKKDEDCHTAIENRLIGQLGETGKKIHTGRSRNDQVLAALRVFTREHLNIITGEVLALSRLMGEFAQKHSLVPMAGRTHMQIAMPSSVGLWAGAYAEELFDSLVLISSAYVLNDRSPLGSAASYGVPLPLDREMVADLLGFSEVHNNVLAVQNGRGKIESIVLDALEQTVLTLAKLSSDLILYSMPEFGYFSLPKELCTGSSIMPQKKNPDGLELLRAKANVLSGYITQIKGIIRNLPSGYNRDFQETKGPLLKGLKLTLDCVRIMSLTFQNLTVHEDKLAKGFIPEIYATDIAIDMVQKGEAFRDAYKKVGLSIDSLSEQNPRDYVMNRKSTGTTGNLNLERLFAKIDDQEALLDKRVNKLQQVYQNLLSQKLGSIDLIPGI
ncbi:MAG: argininosuccinate lyase [Spirochaetales bacterium]|nr:argininosuccinate lyase [Spirochaetales bacterium]